MIAWLDAPEFYRTRDENFVGVLSRPVRGSPRCYGVTAVMEENGTAVFMPAVMPYRRLRHQAQRLDPQDVPAMIVAGMKQGMAMWHDSLAL